ncbi:MAG: hypothetical protein IPI91_20050 [Flavobacteriales bacterium]|nr:hypothetical protein [Flavobacteriales bacterium]
MRPKTMIAVAATIALVGGGRYAWSEFNRGLAETDTMPVKESVTADALYQAFSSDEKAATDRFVGHVEQAIQCPEPFVPWIPRATMDQCDLGNR